MGFKAENNRNVIPSNILSYISTNWITKMLLKIKRTDVLEEEEILLLPAELEIDSIDKKMAKYFEEMDRHIRDKMNYPRPSLIWHLIRIWKKELVWTTTSVLLETLFGALFPLLVQQLILYLEGNNSPLLWSSNGYVILGILITGQLLMTFYPTIFSLISRCELPTIAYLQHATIKKYSRLSLASQKVLNHLLMA